MYPFEVEKSKLLCRKILNPFLSREVSQLIFQYLFVKLFHIVYKLNQKFEIKIDSLDFRYFKVIFQEDFEISLDYHVSHLSPFIISFSKSFKIVCI